ncbi:LacI family DNA-binding transcriptional regulator [Candidatus Clostridium stratigraminis]|uniref:LacI family DNA-binding transcriptional regulator n=1 Tax=Candidatus Clostridium stratigraminis TaxID=3381661 RepID=A0ABW8T859_9CLOT
MGTTISDIAKKSGVSLATVSRVLNNSGYVKTETREKVLNAIKDTNYTPSAIARSLSKNETNTIGVVVPDITNSYFGEIIKGISLVAEKNNLNIILFNTDDNLQKELKALDLLKAQRIQGVIMTPNFGENDINTNYINKLENLGIPLVLVAADVKYSNLNGVFVDNMKGAFDATDILIKEGHTKIGIIKGQKDSKPASEMFMGYQKALLYNNLDVREDYIYTGDFKLDLAYDITKKILKMKDRPSALLVSSNMMTLGCVKAVLEEKMKIPEDLAIIGFNKIDVFDVIDLGISYVDDSALELGRASMEMLSELIKAPNKNDVRRITVRPVVVLKGSEKVKKNRW